MSRKQLVWIFAMIALILAIIVLYQQTQLRQQSDRGIKSVRNGTVGTTTPTVDDIVDMVDTSSIMSGETSSGSSLSGDVASGSTTTQVVITDPQDSTCVLSYQALVDRVQGLSGLEGENLASGLEALTTLGYCNGSTPDESDFLVLNSEGQTVSYDSDTDQISVDGVDAVIPDFLVECDDECPDVQAIRHVRQDNNYVVLDVTQPRSFQHSFRLTSLTNGVTMLYWAALSYVDPLASYARSEEGHFIFIASIGRTTQTYIVQPRSFPTSEPITTESDTPLALSINGSTLTVLYDRDVSNTDRSDRYTKSYEISDLGQSSTGSGSAQ